MDSSSIIRDIDKKGLCLGCGLCESICGKEAVEMKLQPDGFIHPIVKQVIPSKEKIIKEICPGLNISNDIEFSNKESIWGHIEELWSGYSSDTEVRTKGSSGGIVSGIAIYLLENKIVDGVLQVGGDVNDYERNALKISYNRESVLSCASSRYAPASIFQEIFEILDKDKSTYCFIGKPCDISALKNFLVKFPEYSNRFKLTVSIMCAGMPSFNGTRSIIDDFQAVHPVKDLVYRGNGWPGYFSFTDGRGESYRKSYNDSWGKTLNKHLKFRCKVCPDGIGIQADIAVGDAWETKDGYPDFTEKEGQSLIISRTEFGTQMLKRACSEGKMELETLELSKIQLMQPYQYARRTRVFARMLAFSVVSGTMLNFKNLKLRYNIRFVGKKLLFREFKGTLVRLLKQKLKK